MGGYASKVCRDIERWTDDGLIDGATADALKADIARRGAGAIGFGTVLAIMAASLFGAAILILIAANWDLIPRPARVLALFGLIAGGYCGGAVLMNRDRDGFAEALWVLAAIAFGASIALVGQMYHLSGDEKQAIFIWGAGTAFAAVALRSWSLTVGAVLLGAIWMTMHGFAHYSFRELPGSYLAIAAALWVVSFWTGSVVARHLILLSLYLFALFLHWQLDRPEVPLLLILAAGGLLAFGRYRPNEAARYIGLGENLPVQALGGFLAGVGILQTALIDDPQFVFVSIAALVGIVALLLIDGRDNALLRWLAYLAFAFQLCFVYIVTLGSMLGTAGFFLVAGVALAALAIAVARFERRFAAPTEIGSASW